MLSVLLRSRFSLLLELVRLGGLTFFQFLRFGGFFNSLVNELLLSLSSLLDEVSCEGILMLFVSEDTHEIMKAYDTPL